MEAFAVTCPLVPGVPPLVSGSCASPRACGLAFLQTPPHGERPCPAPRLRLREYLARGLAPRSFCAMPGAHACGEPRPMAEATQERTLLGVGFRVGPAVTRRPPHRPVRERFTHPVPRSPASRHHAGASRCGPARPLRWCGRSWVSAERRSPAAAGIAPSRSHSCSCDDAARRATPAPPSDGQPPTDGRALGDHRTGSAPATSGRAAGIGMSAGRADGCDTTATATSWCDGAASGRFCG